MKETVCVRGKKPAKSIGSWVTFYIPQVTPHFRQVVFNVTGCRNQPPWTCPVLCPVWIKGFERISYVMREGIGFVPFIRPILLNKVAKIGWHPERSEA